MSGVPILSMKGEAARRGQRVKTPAMAAVRMAVAFITRNNKAQAVESLKSLMAGSTTNCVVVVWDDASTDGTWEEMRRLGNEHRMLNVVPSGLRLGVEGALTKAMDLFGGPSLVCLARSDAVYPKGWDAELSFVHRLAFPHGAMAASWKGKEFDGPAHRLMQHGRRIVQTVPNLYREDAPAVVVSSMTYARLGMPEALSGAYRLGGKLVYCAYSVECERIQAKHILIGR